MSLYRWGATVLYTAIGAYSLQALIPNGFWLHLLMLPVCSAGLIATLIMED